MRRADLAVRGSVVFVVFLTAGTSAALELTATLLDESGQPAKGRTLRSMTWELTDTSQEPGVTINFPVNATDTDLDLELSPGRIPGAVDEKRQRVIRDGLQAPSDSVWVVSLDWGGWATLKATGTLSTGEKLTAILSSTRASEVLIPWRTADSHVATTWKRGLMVDGQPDDADDENTDGDGLTLYEEYRGIMLQGKHRSLHPRRRDLVVHLHDLPGSAYAGGAYLYGEAADLEVRVTRRDDECEQNETPRLNTNTRRGAHRVDQHAVRISSRTSRARRTPASR